MFSSNQAVLSAALAALSHARVSNYRAFFGVTSDAEAYGLYVWNEALSNAFSRTLAALEIAMRNQFHAALSARYGAVGSASSRDWFNHISLQGKSSTSVQELTHTRKRVKGGIQHVPRTPTPSPDDVVSRLTFGFWPHLLDVQVDQTGQPIDWAAILVDVLPGHRQRNATYWATQRHRDALFARIDFCNSLRNRIAHHEPIWKAGPLLEEVRPRQNVRPLVVQKAPATPYEAIARLDLAYTRTLELLEWFSKDLAAMVCRSEAHHRFMALNTKDALEGYRRHAGLSRDKWIELTTHRKLRGLKTEFRKLSKRHGAVEVRYAGLKIGHFLAC